MSDTFWAIRQREIANRAAAAGAAKAPKKKTKAKAKPAAKAPVVIVEEPVIEEDEG